MAEIFNILNEIALIFDSFVSILTYIIAIMYAVSLAIPGAEPEKTLKKLLSFTTKKSRK